MRRGHRTAHPAVVLVCGALAAGLYCHGWSVRAERPSPQPLGAPEPPAGASWEVAIPTPAGVAAVRYFGAEAPPFLWATLPAGLDAAEPGLILELGGGAPPRVLGSIAPGRPVVQVPGGLGASTGPVPAGAEHVPPGTVQVPPGTVRGPAGAGGGRLVLADLARDARLGWVDLPPDTPR